MDPRHDPRRERLGIGCREQDGPGILLFSDTNAMRMAHATGRWIGADTSRRGTRANSGRALEAFLLAFLATFATACQATQVAPPPTPTIQSVTATPRMAPTHEWILIDLPPGASQLEYGSEVYRLVCQDCHGNHGQGLTADWRATWAPQDQNCWQSKCHGPDHPPDGFVLPIAPPVVGSAAMSQFGTAQDLHDLIQVSMPWYNPGSLTERDSWAVTAQVLKMNGIDPGIQLGPDTAHSIRVGQ